MNFETKEIERLEAGFIPSQTDRKPEHRIAAASEFMAYRLGQIDQKLGEISESLRLIAEKNK